MYSFKFSEWAKRNSRQLSLTFLPPTAVSGLALATHLQYGTAAAAVESAVAVLSASLSLTSFSKKWSSELSWGAASVALAATQASVTTTSGFSALSVYTWLISVGLSWAATMVLKHHTRHDHHRAQMAEVNLDISRIKAQTAQIRLAHQIAQYEARINPAPTPAGPDLTGRSPLEADILRAIYDLYKVEVPRIDIEPFSDSVGWISNIYLPAELTREKLAKEWHRVSGALRMPGRFLVSLGAFSNQLVVRYQEGDPLAAVVPYEPSRARSFLEPILLGRDEMGQAVYIEFAYNHTVIAGSSKFGKSNIVKLIIMRLADLPDSVVYGVDMKPGSPELSLMSPVLHDLATTPEQAKALFQWLTEEMHERGAILAKSGDTAWLPDKHGRPAIFVVVDELGELVRQGDRVPRGEVKMSDRIESLLALARAYGIHLILSTQTPSNRVFGKSTDPRGNLAIRISTRMNDSKHAAFVFSGNTKYKPNALDLQGKFLVLSPEHSDGLQSRAQFVSDDIAATEMLRLSLEMIPAPINHRAILPAPEHLNNQGRIRDRLDRYGEMSRRELEVGCNLTKEQVLRALREMAPEVGQDHVTSYWSLRPESSFEPSLYK